MFQRIANFWLSSFVTERLLASPLFHRMAAKTHQHVSTVTEKGTKTGSEFMKAFKENLEKEARNARK
ncbi:hypothetical protein J3Q64DRAFT_1745159 [Phycomyces blakesleeanus]|uniref:Uncharacterized protein n=2 Tax=Phycomyces blakesleeanus TaxID=4837 RepID=A0A162NH22_PHYB8|nr:hypothetical protein PHYBLDRAFT_144612 [Phycomyces blakesleeanus NRRL 1555(-)]KAI9021706.1 hypothetical protein CLU79DRAFT_816325 [Phycomyces nitens]OAD74158.1 hypothetical protein PHYBLDRAFT_144612 [Phycomyces blakesleeanus NRRL 1555(-)]|eukprot:XP_018292198.1 hypothetical protein PHYBLDRAFT_144612 [Phycomyces blakesleeanus NRRL 1555(-)]